MIVKQNGVYCAHIFGTLFDYMILEACALYESDTYDTMKQATEKWGSPEGDNLTEEDIDNIVNYKHKLMGDRVFMLDHDAKTFSHYFSYDKNWKIMTKASIEEHQAALVVEEENKARIIGPRFV